MTCEEIGLAFRAGESWRDHVRRMFLAGLLAAAAGLGCRTTSAASTFTPASSDDPATLKLAELQVAASTPPSPYVHDVVRGEDVACFVEERGTANGATVDRAAFDAWSREAQARLARDPGATRAPTTLEGTVARLGARLERTIAERGTPLRQGRIAFGALATGSARPWVISVPGADRTLVVLDDRLFDMVYAVVSAAFDVPMDGVMGGCDAVLDALHSQSLIRARFAVNLRHFVGAAKTGRYNVTPRQPARTMALVRSAELFLLAHEYAHVLLRHTPVRVVNHLVGSGDGPASVASELSYGLEQDLAADALAFDLVQETLRRDGSEGERALAASGPDVMLFTIEMLEFARAIYAGVDPPLAPGDVMEARMSRPVPVTGAAASAVTRPDAAEWDGRAQVWARRKALGAPMRRAGVGGAAEHFGEAAAFVEQTDACILASVSRGLAASGERRRSVDRTIEALRRAEDGSSSVASAPTLERGPE